MDFNCCFRRDSHIFEYNQAIKAKFRQSKILILVANGSTGATSVTAPWGDFGQNTAIVGKANAIIDKIYGYTSIIYDAINTH